MIKICRVLNILNNANINPFKLDTEFSVSEEYSYIEIPDDGKPYKWDGKQAVEDIESEMAIAKKKKVINDLQNLYSSFDKGLQVCFSPAKDAVLIYVEQNDYNSAKEVIAKYPLPTVSGVDLEKVRQQFLALLQG